MSIGEWNHTYQVGPVPSHKWNWNDPELQARAAPGVILMTDDCAYFVVEEVRPTGLILAPGLARPFWNWDRLRISECTPVGTLDNPPSGGG